MENIWDKQRFARLLERATGQPDRSINQYAKYSGVSATYICDFINCKRERPPGVEVIKKLASKAHHGVTYEELMAAAGHLPQPENIYKIVDLERFIKEEGVEYGGIVLTEEEKKSVLGFTKLALETIRKKQDK